ncbi:flagellar biosynthesis protein, partial [Klebsiella quasipneumoniae subsp. quasipneumoniae]|nr:flagellar biosynthesis protein [Klebsiella quasipneumoniae subsp. quasipneumoniae]
MLDKVVTSTELTYTDRLGGEHYTVDGIKAEGDKVVEETRQNLIPLSRQYMTLADAQADIENIPVGSTTYYRSPDDSALAIEVINNSGTLESTGRKMPSQEYLQQLISSVLLELYNTNDNVFEALSDFKRLLLDNESETV